MTEAAEVIGAALAATPDYPEENPELQREHVIWLWNTYSGLAHTYGWPRLMPSSGRDRRVPGDFPGDLFMVANIAHIAMLSLQSRLESGSANTTAPVPLGSEPPKHRAGLDRRGQMGSSGALVGLLHVLSNQSK